MSSQRQYVGATLKSKQPGVPPPPVLVDPLIKMLSSGSAKMKFLSCSSTVGFMCVLDVSEEDSEFLEPDNSTVITSFMLKIVVISTNADDELPIESRRRPELETQLNYEDRIQNRVWKSSTITGNEQICPPVIDLKLLKTDNSPAFLQMLAPKVTENKHVLQELISIIITSKSTPALGILGLGIILMPNIKRSVTLYNFLHFRNGHDFFGNRVTSDIKDHVLKLTVSKIFLLFFQCGIIHTDLHQNNILVYTNKSGRINVLIIDFGKVIDIEYYTQPNHPPPEQMRVSIERLISIKHKKTPTQRDNEFLLDYYNDHTDWKELYSKTPHCINALFELGMDTSSKKRKHGGGKNRKHRSIKLIRTSKNKRFKTKRTLSFNK
jgi:hypothetical protein